MQRALKRRGGWRFVTIRRQVSAPYDKGGRQVTRRFLAVVVSDTLILKEVNNVFSTISFHTEIPKPSAKRER
jgi:hypothetical protein